MTRCETGQKPGPKRFDERGIALQTIIIIVVLIAIAGGVAIALQQRAGDAIADLESVDTSADIDTAAECTGHSMGGVFGTHNATTCNWSDATANNNVTRARCLLVRGVYSTATTASVCTITY